jgi:multiple sugar transport system substrate-binding protein
MSYYLGLAKYSLKEKQEVLDHYFKSGKLGMQISGAWNLKNFAIEAPSLDYGVALVPKPARDRGFHGSFAGAEILVVFAKSKQKPLALELARYLQAYPQAKQVSLSVGSVFPAARAAMDDPTFLSDERMAVFIKQAFESRTPPAHPGWLEMEDVINKAVEEVIYGRATPESALKAAGTGIERIVKKFESR